MGAELVCLFLSLWKVFQNIFIMILYWEVWNVTATQTLSWISHAGSYEVHTFSTKSHSLGKGFTLTSSLVHYIENKSLFISKLERYKEKWVNLFLQNVDKCSSVYFDLILSFSLSSSLCLYICSPAPSHKSYGGPGLHLTLTHVLNYHGLNWSVSDRKSYNPSFVPVVPIIISIIY